MVPPENKTASHSALDIKIVFSPGNNGHIAGARRTRSSVCGQPSVFSVPSSLQKAVCSMGQSSLSPHPYRRQCAVWDSLHCPLIPTEGCVQFSIFSVPPALQTVWDSLQCPLIPREVSVQYGTVFTLPSSLQKAVSSMGQSSLSPQPYRRQCPVWDSLHCPLSPTEGSVQYCRGEVRCSRTVFSVPQTKAREGSARAPWGRGPDRHHHHHPGLWTQRLWPGRHCSATLRYWPGPSARGDNHALSGRLTIRAAWQ